MVKKQDKKSFAVSFESKGEGISSVKIKCKPLNLQVLLSVCEELMNAVVELREENKNMSIDIADMQQDLIIIRENLSVLNSDMLNLKLKLNKKPWWKRLF